MPELNTTVVRVTDRIRQRSRDSRDAYLARIRAAVRERPSRARLGCTNLAHAFAACAQSDKERMKSGETPNVGIVSAYNDMLSAHEPLHRFPDVIREAARGAGATAQFAGGVPAMCDGVTQGQPGMQLSLLSRDVIARATAVALSHDTFDAVFALGTCDKIVPGLLMGALAFGHLPAVFSPAGPMPSGISNAEKARTRQLFAEGKVDERALLDSEAKAYHAPGTCTFYGTANTNQILMEVFGLHAPGSSFVPPASPLRDALTTAATRRVVALTAGKDEHLPLGELFDARTLVNGVVALLATGGSTNHAIHLVAIARMAGLSLTWEDMDELSRVVPLLARVYPNGTADVNQFHAAGGTSFLLGELLGAGLLHGDARTAWGDVASTCTQRPVLTDDGAVAFEPGNDASGDAAILAPASDPHAADGGLRLITGNLGRAIVKVSAVRPENRVVEAPARVFDDPDLVRTAFESGELDRDVVVALRFQGPRANGMPELHALMPFLGVLQDRGHAVALVTDGRLSGASGKVPSAIHACPEARDGGPLAKLRDGDRVRVDGEARELSALVDDAEWSAREPVEWEGAREQWGVGRELFAGLREATLPADRGALTFGLPE